MEREAALELLRSQHDFPGTFKFRVVVRPDCVDSVLSAIAEGAGEQAGVREVQQRLSRKGNYLALHVDMDLPSVESVLDVYRSLHGLDGVLTAL